METKYADADEDKNQRSEESSGMIITWIVVIYVGVLIVGMYVASYHLKKKQIDFDSSLFDLR
jgi:flagellar basal body-associated protein FliL